MTGIPPSLDHLVLAVPDLATGIAAIEAELGVRCLPGGAHPAWGTRNALVPLGPAVYLEAIGPDPERPAGPRPALFGIADLTRPRLATWAARAAGLAALVARARARGIDLGEVLQGRRLRPDGVILTWALTDPLQPRAGGVLPFFIDWGDSPHPAGSGPAQAELLSLRAEHPDPPGVGAQLGHLGLALEITPGLEPGLCARLRTPRGEVELR